MVKEQKIRFNRCSNCDQNKAGSIDPTIVWISQIRKATLVAKGASSVGEVTVLDGGLECTSCLEASNTRVEIIWNWT